MATNISFLYNNALDLLISKAMQTNKFTGYLKAVDDKYFVKEIDSYLFFPVIISPWQLLPTEDELNEPVTFSLENLDKKNKVQASLTNNTYIPEFNKAIKLYKSKTPVEAEVYKVSPHAIYLNIIGDKIKAKLPLKKDTPADHESAIKPGDKINVLISYMGKTKIVVEPVSS